MTKILRASIVLVALAAGCGGGAVSVSGTVTYKGNPLSYGTVLLVDASGLPKSGQIGPDGSFSIAGVVPGAAKVAVSSPRPPGMQDKQVLSKGGRDADVLDDKKPREQPSADPAVIAGWTAIPDDYGDPAKSKLTADVKSGEPLNIDLK